MELEKHESEVARETIEAVKQMLDAYIKTIQNDDIKAKYKRDVDIVKTVCIAIVAILAFFIVMFAPAQIDVKNVSESKSEVITDDVAR